MSIAEDMERTSIQEELSNMTFEELLKLKEEVGGKVYNEAVFGVRRTKYNFKRENKNRPREVSSKVPPPIIQEVIPTKKIVHRDPRFDPLCGDFNEKAFKSAFSFVSDVKRNEVVQLKEQLKNETKQSEKERIQYLITRMENQEREEGKLKAKQEKEREEHKTRIEMLRLGKKPQFQKKSEKRVLGLVEQYEELKKSGKLHKHIEKQRRKNAMRDRKKLDIAQ